ncbi:hypothetical protein ABBQ32_012484 [Trebouxia sp. C0010 RCD-2024]
MRMLIHAILSCLFLNVDTFLGLVGKAILNVLAFQLGCAINAICVPIVCRKTMLPALGFTQILQSQEVKVTDNPKAETVMKKERSSINVGITAHSESPSRTQT